MNGDIEGLLKYYGGKKEKERYPLLKTAQFFTPLEAKEFGIDLQEGWLLKMTPGENGAEPILMLKSPKGEEVSFEDVLVAESGEWITRTEYEAPIKEYEAAQEEFRRAFGEVFPEQELEDLIAGLTVTEGMTLPEQVMADKRAQEFYNTLIEIGRTPETEAILKWLGATEEDIGEFFVEAEMGIPTEGVTIPMETEGGEAVDALLKPDFSLWIGDTEVGVLNPETGEFEEKELEWWQKALGLPVIKEVVTGLGFLLAGLHFYREMIAGALFVGIPEIARGIAHPARPEAGTTIESLTRAFRENNFWAAICEFFVPEAQRERIRERKEAEYEAPSIEERTADLNTIWNNWEAARAKYKLVEAPSWVIAEEKPKILRWLMGEEGEWTLGVKGLVEVMAELPIWLSIPCAIALRASLVPTAAGRGMLAITARAARVSLAPLAGLEIGAATGLRYGVGIPLKYITVTLPKTATKKAFEVALDAGLDKWLVRQGIRGNQANRVVAYFLKANHAWLYKTAQENLLKHMAKRRGVDAVAKAAAEDTIKLAEPLLLVAAREASVKAGTEGMAPGATRALATIADRVATRGLVIDNAAVLARIFSELAPRAVLEKTPSLMLQLRDMGYSIEAIEGMTAEEAWVNLFKKMPAEVVPEEVGIPMPAEYQQRILAEFGKGTPGLSTQLEGLVYRDPRGNPVAVITLHAEPSGAIRIGSVVNVAEGLLKGKATMALLAEIKKIENVVFPPPSEMSPEALAIYNKFKMKAEPEIKAEVIQAKIGDYLKAQKYIDVKVANRIKEIKKLLAVEGRLPTGKGTKAELSLELARLEAQKELAAIKTSEGLDNAIEGIQNELGLRSMPYHGGTPNLYPEYTSKQLDEILKVYEEARIGIAPEIAKKPLPALPEPATEVVGANLETIGSPTLTPAQVEKTLELFGKYVISPSTENAWELTRELRRETRAARAESLKVRVQELIISKGMPVEDAMNQAIRETMSGELPIARADYLDDLTERMREVLFNKLYQTLREEPFEMMSTAEALTNALLGKPIPRELGVRGGSAYTRLERVFGEQPETFRAISEGAKEGKTLQGVIEDLYMEVGKPPLPIDPQMANWLRSLASSPHGIPTIFEKPTDLTVSTLRTPAELEYAKRKLELDLELSKGKIDVTRYKIELALAVEKAYPPPPKPPYEPPIEGAIKEVPMWPVSGRNAIIKVLKEIGYSPIDIGNFLRANKASFDFSFWRQQAPLILNHKADFFMANVEGWKAIFSQKAAEASWERIVRDPLFHLYDQIGIDFLRPLELAKGTAQWRGVEEFGYLTGERLIPNLTQKIPWVKISARCFVTGTNVHNWLIFKNHHRAMLKINERIASGRIKLKPGEAFSIEKEMREFASLLTDLSGRGQLGRAAGLAPAISSMFFAPRYTIGRILSPRHLISANPRIRAEAWKDLVTFVAGVGGLVLLGKALDLWDVELDPHSAEYMSIRIGETRIDPWGGYRQYLVFLTRIVTGTGLSSVTGAEYDVNPLMAATHFVRGKAAPLFSILMDFWTGKTFVGEEVDVSNMKQWLERMSPFAIWDIYEAYMEDPGRAVGIAIPAILGAGVQTYTGDWVDNWPKLGLPKYPENLTYGQDEPVYDVKDFWSDTASQFRDVDPATLTVEKGYPPHIRAIAEAYNIILPQLDDLPNEKLIHLNADPDIGITFDQFYQMWRDREKIVASGDLKALQEFDADERTRNANSGNFSQSQFALLVKYHSFTDKKKQSEWLEGLDEAERNSITTNPRIAWLKAHPEDNAKLAVWGQAKIYSMEAYRLLVKEIGELDIPYNAIFEQTLPPSGSVENYFKYLELGEEFGWNSAEVRLLVAQDDDLRKWLGREEITTPSESLEISVKWREMDDKYDALKTTEDRKAFLEGNVEYAEDRRRRDAYYAGFAEELIDTYAEYYMEYADKPLAPKDVDEDWFVGMSEQYDALKTDEEREAFLEENSRFAVARREYEVGWYEDDWFLMEHPEFYRACLELKDWKERDFSKVPSRQVFADYLNYLDEDAGIDRLRFRHYHPELERWLVDVKGYTPVGDRWKSFKALYD